MPDHPARSFTVEALSAQEVAALKELERRNRDLGAPEFLTMLQRERKPFQLRSEAHTILHYLDPRRTDRVLDAGAGVGRLALLVAPKVSRLVCADLSGKALDILQSEAQSRGLRNIETVQGDLCGFPDALHGFDKIYSVEVLQHIPSHGERRAAVRKFYELLKPGGLCLISVHGWNFRNRQTDQSKEGFWGTGDRRLYGYLYSAPELGRLVEEAGFRHVRVRGVSILPGKLTRHLPPSLAPIETWCSRLPFLAGMGHYVMAMGRR